MDKVITICLFFLSSLLLSYQVKAGDIYNSVTEFGAKGDGITDDTDAILRAISASYSKVHSVSNVPGVYAGPVYFGNAKTIYFPAGLYKISKPIIVSSFITIKGDKAVLMPSQAYKAKSIGIIGTDSWLSHIEGIQFVGFNEALHIENNNLDCGKVEIEDCDFLSNEIAIQIKASSSFVNIHNNRFINNQKVALLIGAQKTDMSDNWITSGTLKGKHDAQIISNGVLHFDKNILVPINPAAGAIEPAWINNYGTVIINGTRQGGESGSFTLVNNFSKAAINPFWPNAVMISKSECYAVYGNEKNHTQPAALRLIEVPNNIVLEDLVGFIEASLVDFSRVNDPSAVLKKMTPRVGSSIYKIKVYNIQNAQAVQLNGSFIPQALAPFEVK